MLDQFKTMGALAGLMRDKDRIRLAGERIRATLDANPAEGEAGGGAVRVVVGSGLRVRSIGIAPAVACGLGAEGAARDEAERLIADAVNNALDVAQQRLRDALDAEARTLGLDGLPPDLRGLLG